MYMYVTIYTNVYMCAYNAHIYIAYTVGDIEIGIYRLIYCLCITKYMGRETTFMA